MNQVKKYVILIASVLFGIGGYLFLRRVGRNGLAFFYEHHSKQVQISGIQVNLII